MFSSRLILLVVVALGRAALGYPALGDYMPVSNVLEQAQMGFDVAAFLNALRAPSPNYALAKDIYTNGGGNSCKSLTVRRKLRDFALANLTGESYYDTLIAGGAMPGFWDAWMIEALDGTGRFANLSSTRRATSLRQGVYHLVTYYAAHELEQGVLLGLSTATRSDNSSAKYWDEGWAFYRGADVNGTGAPWYLTSEYDSDFPDGLKVRTALTPHFNKGLAAVRAATYNGTAAVEARDTIFRLWAIMPLRASLKYLQLVERTYSERQHAEGYGHYMGIDAWLAAKSPAAAGALRQALDIRLVAVPNGTFCNVKQVLEMALPALGLDCNLFGSYRLANTSGIQCATACSAPPVTLPAGASAVAAVDGSAADINCTAAALPSTTATPSNTQVSSAQGVGAALAAALAPAFLSLALALTAF